MKKRFYAIFWMKKSGCNMDFIGATSKTDALAEILDRWINCISDSDKKDYSRYDLLELSPFDNDEQSRISTRLVVSVLE